MFFSERSPDTRELSLHKEIFPEIQQLRLFWNDAFNLSIKFTVRLITQSTNGWSNYQKASKSHLSMNFTMRLVTGSTNGSHVPYELRTDAEFHYYNYQYRNIKKEGKEALLCEFEQRR